MRILSAAQMRETDRRTVQDGHASWLHLMEAAGAAVAECAVDLHPPAQRFTVVCGKGNNGGDGLVAARLLRQRGKNVVVLLCAAPARLSHDASEMYERINQAGSCRIHQIENEADLQEPESTAALANADVIIDALLGTGIKPPVQGFYRSMIDAMNAATAPILAVDLPSGADADAKSDDLCVHASAVVTFTAPKLWHLWSTQSDLPTAVAAIGTPKKLIDEVAQGDGDAPQLFTPRDLPENFFVRAADSNKGKYGHVLIVAGSLGKAGAPAMAAMAALRTGAGLATVACPGSVLPTIAAFAPELMTELLDGREAEYITERALDAVRKLAENKNVLAVGPGLGRASETESFIHALVAETELPLVLDADGLNAFDGHAELLKQHRSNFLVITPHPGEMARLTGKTVKEVQADRIGIASRFAHEHNCTVVLKGWRTVIASPDGQVWINPTGNPAMSKGGTGDALTGMVAAMIAQHPTDPNTASRAAVYLHGLAGDVALPKFGLQGMLTTDLISAIPEAIRVTEHQPQRITWLHRVSAQ